MQCTRTEWLSDKDYITSLRQKLRQEHVPFSGGISFTSRCNLKCIHCYIGGGPDPEALHEKELNSSEWKSLIDEIAQHGCLNLLITGGEPLLRKDFFEVYCHAKNKGLLVTIFTNGTLIDQDVMSHFREYPPYMVEVSLYGATEKTYERITGVKGSYRRCLDGIRQLVDAGIRLNLKTMLMTLNRHEIQLMRKMALDFDVGFRFDPCLFSRFNGDRAPMRLRVPPEEAVTLDFVEPDQTEKWHKHYEKHKNISASNRLYTCGAGVTGFHIDSLGYLQPCIMAVDYRRKVRAGAFMNGWQEVASSLKKRTAGDDFLCGKCQKRHLCGFCPAIFKLESGDETTKSEYLCEIGQLRCEAISKKGGTNEKTK